MSRSQIYRRLKTIHSSFVCLTNRRLLVKNGNLFDKNALVWSNFVRLFSWLVLLTLVS